MKPNNKLKELHEKFNMAGSLVEELNSIVVDISPETETPTETYLSTDVKFDESIIDISQLKMDFQLVRRNILKVVASGNRILEEACVVDISDLKTSQISALTQLQTALGQNIKLLLDSYKTIAEIEWYKSKKEEKKIPTVNGDMTQNNMIFSGSSSDLLSLIKKQGK